jgi:AcrR family transcriptional regulator
VRRHGWQGAPPRNDEEAVQRIVAATIELIDETGSEISISDVARSLGVIRQTVYRYFPNAEELMNAAAIASVDAFLDRIEDHLRGTTDPSAAVVEGVAYVLEALPKTPHLGLLLSPVRAHQLSAEVTSDLARNFGRSMIHRFDVDWAEFGYDEAALAELVEFLLRTMQSFIVDPGDPPRSHAEQCRYLARWVGSAVAAQKR